jgi:hypothetical protein
MILGCICLKLREWVLALADNSEVEPSNVDFKVLAARVLNSGSDDPRLLGKPKFIAARICCGARVRERPGFESRTNRNQNPSFFGASETGRVCNQCETAFGRTVCFCGHQATAGNWRAPLLAIRGERPALWHRPHRSRSD